MRKLLLVLTSILLVCLINGFVSLRGQQKSAWRNEVPTPVEDGVLTPQQKEHSKLYESFGWKGDKIRDLLLKTTEGISRHRPPGLQTLYPAGAPTPNPIGELSEEADAVVIANFVSKASQITEDGNYVFTDYQLRVEEVLKKTGAGSLKPEETITVTRPGGKVLLFGQIVSYTESSFKPLLPGRRYLLFLNYLPSTQAYRPTSYAGSFDISDSTVKSLNDVYAAQFFEKDLKAFITSVKLAIANSKKNGRSQ